jgi:predicted flap endonuclease-1-like 5' DNA nuclease
LFNSQVGDLIALTVEEGQDWKDVQIPGKSAAPEKSAPPAGSAAPVTPSVSSEEAELHFLAGVGPATNLLLAQYGINPR